MCLLKAAEPEGAIFNEWPAGGETPLILLERRPSRAVDRDTLLRQPQVVEVICGLQITTTEIGMAIPVETIAA